MKGKECETDRERKRTLKITTKAEMEKWRNRQSRKDLQNGNDSDKDT